MVEAMLSVSQLRTAIPERRGNREIVRGVSFQLQPGKVLGIIGESGCGKSATCLSILRLFKRANIQGSIRLAGTEITQLKEAEMRQIRGRQMGMILQNPASFFNPITSIGQQFVETLQSHQMLNRSTARSIAAEHLASVGLAQPQRLLQQFPFQLSGGMLQRVMIAIALALQPKVLIADEPTTALDGITQMQILRLLDQLQQETGCAILLVTHDLGVIAQLADDVAVMYNGEFVEQSSVTHLFDQPQHSYTQSLFAARLSERWEES
ncbi:MAG: ABC transporter ATP-binding protein [Cyanobacteria bacterium RM1_2_2]|nr:ABC transporter ATP-binding protein [Cyanobacteria bacterium RM1_2_2]